MMIMLMSADRQTRSLFQFALRVVWATAILLATSGPFSAEETKTVLPAGKLQVRKVLFLGNSITLHGVAPQIGWNGNWGMAASAEDKDYVHLLMSQIARSTDNKPASLVKNIADFERGLEGFKFDVGLRVELEFEADLVILAIGENASALTTGEAKARYKKAFESLLAELKQHGQPTLIVRSCFWANPAKDEIMKQACADAGGIWVDMSQLGRDEANHASSERKIEHAGVADHPGDKGMQAISDELWKSITQQSALWKESN